MQNRNESPAPDNAVENAKQLHEYLVKKLGHQWRLSTWEKKYLARIRIYGLEACLIAADGFCSMKWYVENHGQDAPDLIYRSDKQLEKFLAVGMKLPEHSPEARERQEKASAKRERQAWIRKHLTRDMGIHERFFKKLSPLKEIVNEQTWETWINPLLVVGMQNGVLLLYHEQADWVQEHYSAKIGEIIGARVRVVDNI